MLKITVIINYKLIYNNKLIYIESNGHITCAIVRLTSMSCDRTFIIGKHSRISETFMAFAFVYDFVF